jgi:uncharacterized protein involved in outer membrane biogenesis
MLKLAMKKIPKKRWIFSLISLFFLGYLTFFGTFLFRKEYWKSILLEKAKTIIGYNLTYSKEDISFFPYPEISLENVSIKNDNEDFSINLESSRITILFSWKKIILKQWKLDDLRLEDGNLTFISKEKNKSNTSSFELPNDIYKFQILSIHLKNINIDLTFNNSHEKVYISNLIYNHTSLRDNSLSLNLNYLNGNIIANLTFGIENNNFNFENFLLHGKINLSNFPLKKFQPYYKIFLKSNFVDSSISGEFSVEKNDSNTINLITNVTLYNLNFQGLENYPPLEIKSSLSYHIKSSKISFSNTKLKLGNHLSVNILGDLILQKTIFLNLYVNSDYFELEKSLEYILAFTDFSIPGSKNKKFTSELNFKCKKLTYKDYDFGESEGKVAIDDSNIKVNISKASLYNGNILGDGILSTANETSYDFSFKLQNVDLEKLINKYTDKKFISGNLDTELHLHSIGDTFPTFEKNLKIKGISTIKNGKLTGYTNFLKPILTLGKYVNILGPKGESGEFQSITSHFFIEKRTIDIPDMKMVGVGIDAKGKGNINFDGEIEIQIQVGLGGIAGKAFSIPIIYKGQFNKNAAYIDPIWLGSVYLGVTLSGPIGLPAGGVAGAIASEYIRNSVDSIKNFFNFSKNNNSMEKKEE